MSPSSVAVHISDGDYVVVIVENGLSSRHPFKIREHAESYADGQRVRLGLTPEASPHLVDPIIVVQSNEL